MRVFKTFTFDSAHWLPDYDGPCGNLHGHTYLLEVGVGGEMTDAGMVVDFGTIKKDVNKIIDRFDHALINDFLQLPTAENMALEILKEVEAAGYESVLVRLYETPTSFVEVES